MKPTHLCCLILLALVFDVTHADDFKVGQGGTHTDIQSAIDAAVALTGGSHTIRVQAGTYVENLVISTSTHQLDIRGGWNATFTQQTLDPSITIVDGNGSQVVNVLLFSSAYLILDNFTFTNGAGVRQGAGVYVETQDTSEAFITNSHIIGNTVVPGAGQPEGGGIFARAQNSSIVEIEDNLIAENETMDPDPSGNVRGGGVLLKIEGNSEMTFSRNVLRDNACVGPVGPGTAASCAIEASLDPGSGPEPDTGALFMRDNVFADTRMEGFSSNNNSVAGTIACFATGSALLERNRWLGGTIVSGPSVVDALVYLYAEGGCGITTRSSLVVGGPEIGLFASSYEMGLIRIVNLTATQNGGHGLWMYPEDSSAVLSVYNSILYGNAGSGPDPNFHSTGPVDQDSNLIGTDPLFAIDYSVRTGSPALDAGNNNPPGGVGAADVDKLPRVQNGVVDIGAHEGVKQIFADGFEEGNKDAWSSSKP